MTSSDIQSLRSKYESAGQGHVFQFWDKLSPSEQESLLTQLDQINPQFVTEVAQNTLNGKHNTGVATPDIISPLPKEATGSVVDADPSQIAAWSKLGLEAIAANKVGVVLLSGGQGTRLGSSNPKGCYDVNLPSHKSLFQLQAERIIKITELAKAAVPTASESVVVPWYIMTSGPTRKSVEQFFKDNKYFGLDPANVIFFEQGVLPCLTPEGKIILESKSSVAVAPDGNGGIYNALYKHNILADIKKRGIEHIHTYCVDNCLVKVADPAFIGFALQRNVDIATKVVRKRDATESVGLIVSKNGAPGVIEYSEIPSELASATEAHDDKLLKFRAANIVNHYYSAKFLLNIPNWESSFLPFHVAHKKIPFADAETGSTVKPSAPNGVKLEQFVFDVFPRLAFNNFASLEVNRQDEFSPLKNGPGAKVDCPETSRSDVLGQSARWLTAAGAILEGDVEVSPLTSYGGEGLESFKGRKIPASSIV
ncbi:UDP-N-acetylglucosamine diphosphorylase [Sugiyamaella lignohabitans]|uniref:UDP-N-acetylglucosamine diphosphorylase n=1 Tax=Sugiyamaella lignohabitans TaxID=796027 RepID=A0A161HKI1_9ASCO|nr:UDP-N-acetylglucosamine diphosphorylase [Sugiyamaella lignohabitans]ANB13517.1 UDP-N-acetylglucosamine diphosphorylase [Sugiyamaella lignohabitans]